MAGQYLRLHNKTSLLFFLAILFSMLLTGKVLGQAPSPMVEVLYFHRTNRCETCLSIEEKIIQTIHKTFKKELNSGALVFQTLDFQIDHEDALVLEHEVEDPALLIILHKKKKDVIYDLTAVAFNYINTDPEKVEEEISETIKMCFR